MSSRNPGNAYQGALEASIALALCVGAGVWADDSLDTSPWFLLVGLGIGFAAFTVRLIRLAGERGETERDDQESGQK